jgi:hypothetical protein
MPKSAKTDDDLDETIDDAYAESFTSLLFHPSADELEISKTAVTIQVALDVPEETEDILVAHHVVLAPVKRFTDRVRRELTGRQVTVKVVVDSLSDDPNDAWRRLKIAIVDQAKEPALFQQLELVRSKRR